MLEFFESRSNRVTEVSLDVDLFVVGRQGALAYDRTVLLVWKVFCDLRF